MLTAGYFTLRMLLSAGAENAAAVALALHPGDAIELKRRVIAPPPPPPPPPPPDRITQLQRIRAALATEKLACAMTADQTGSFIIIRVCDLVLFEAGRATVLDAFKPVAARVAATLDKEPKHIKVVGHTDNTPISTVRFPSNFELSVERAKAVACRAPAGPHRSGPDRYRRQGSGCADRQQRDPGGGAPGTGASKSSSNAANSPEWIEACFQEDIEVALYGVGLGSLAAIVFFAGPFIAIGDWHPLENTTVRAIVILLIVAGAAGVAGFDLFRRRKAAKEIADGIGGAEQTVNDEGQLF